MKKASSLLNRGIEVLLFGLGFSMTLLVAVQVFCRYVLNHSLFWSEEMARFLLVWLTFLGASCAYYRQVNPGVDFLYARLPQLMQKFCTILTHLVSIGLFSVMVVYGYQFAWFVRLQISPALQIPKWVVMSIIPFSGAVLAFHAVTFLIEAVNRGDHDH